jgi:polysaccharide biosynthesis/export protein
MANDGSLTRSDQRSRNRRKRSAARQRGGGRTSRPESAIPSGNRLMRLFPIDPWRICDELQKRAVWIVLCSLGVAAIGFNWAYLAADSRADVKLVRTIPTGVAALKVEKQGFEPREHSLQETVDLLQSPELIRRVISSAQLRIKPEEVVSRTRISTGLAEDPITITYRGSTPAMAVQVVNAYAREAMNLSDELRREELKQITDFLTTKLTETDNALKESTRTLLSGTVTSSGGADVNALAFLDERIELEKKAEKLRFQISTLDLQIEKLMEEIAKQHPTLVKAREDLDRALLRFTDEHPKVKELRAAITALRAQITQKSTNSQTDLIIPPNSAAGTLYLRVVDLRTERIGLEKQLDETLLATRQLQERLHTLPEAQVQYAATRTDNKSLQARRELLAKYHSDVQFLLQDTSGSLRVFQWAREEDAHSLEKFRRATLAGVCCVLIAVFLSALLVSVWELCDGRIRTPRDLARAARLPVLASLGDLKNMTEEQCADWAFRTLTILKARMTQSDNRALVCGFISARHGEGRSTWVDLLAKAARRRGDRVLVISPPVQRSSGEEAPVQQDDSSSQALVAPGNLAQQLMVPGAPPILQITLPGSTWNCEWRQRWQEALQQWNRIENLVLLVDLPPASSPEAVLLSEQIPQLIWLCARDKATTTETRTQMETLRSAKCELAGSVFNQAVIPAWRRRFAHLASVAWLGWWFSVVVTHAQPASKTEAPIPPGTPAGTRLFSISSPDQLADWQRKLTLGAGDILNISIYEEPDSMRTDLTIGPDGRLNYLEARDVMAAGLTVDELRAHLDEILGKIHREPRTVIIPRYNSKKFFMLGNVAKQGPVSLDRPLTLVEAVARAGGFVSKEGLILADFSRSFVVRKSPDGAFAPATVDFEGLFLRGDLTQNLAMAPEDYVYFLPVDVPEIYVLGDGMASAGPLQYSQNMTVLKAIASRGGYADKAWKARVLVVRGSLTHPQTFVINTRDIEKAKAVDFKLQPRDIVYVSRRPWAFAEELLELAVRDFVRAMAVSWAGAHIGPFIDEPFF